MALEGRGSVTREKQEHHYYISEHIQSTTACLRQVVFPSPTAPQGSLSPLHKVGDLGSKRLSHQTKVTKEECAEARIHTRLSDSKSFVLSSSSKPQSQDQEGRGDRGPGKRRQQEEITGRAGWGPKGDFWVGVFKDRKLGRRVKGRGEGLRHLTFLGPEGAQEGSSGRQQEPQFLKKTVKLFPIS